MKNDKKLKRGLIIEEESKQAIKPHHKRNQTQKFKLVNQKNKENDMKRRSNQYEDYIRIENQGMFSDQDETDTLGFTNELRKIGENGR